MDKKNWWDLVPEVFEQDPTEITDESINQIIEKEFREKTAHPLSQELPENPYELTDPLGAEYGKILEQYYMNPRDAKWSEVIEDVTPKTDYLDEDNASIGWKFHLNVTQENVVAVSKYMKKHGYDHKYLYGGEPEDGKIFTVYIGSFAAAERLSKVLSDELKDHLARPSIRNRSEIEFAPGIVGRFSGIQRIFNQYGTSGFTLLQKDSTHLSRIRRWQKGSTKPEEYERLKQQAEIRAFKKLQEDYGEYFFPDKTMATAA